MPLAAFFPDGCRFRLAVGRFVHESILSWGRYRRRFVPGRKSVSGRGDGWLSCDRGKTAFFRRSGCKKRLRCRRFSFGLDDGSVIEFAGFGVVDAIEEFLCIDVAADGGFFKPVNGFFLVFLDALATVVHVAQEGGGVRVAGFGALGEQGFGFCVVLFDVFALDVHDAENGLCQRFVLVGGLGQQGDGFGRVSFFAVVQIDQAEEGLGIAFAVGGCFFKPFFRFGEARRRRRFSARF